MSWQNVKHLKLQFHVLSVIVFRLFIPNATSQREALLEVLLFVPAQCEYSFKVFPERWVQGEIDDRVVAGVGHGQPMRAQPDHVHVREVVDLWVVVPDQSDDVEWEPAYGVDDHDDDDHFDQL